IRLTSLGCVSLMKVLPKFADAISDATKSMGPHRLVTYLREVATEYSRFNNDCFILREPEEVALPRLALSEAARQVLNNGLTILGISAPERM
ncbi:MAG: DALR anticodon-binding domain-containing protein, partial [Bacteroidota bacterium]